MYDVIIIGAGVVGGMIARELSKFNVSVLILEKENDVARGATAANSGIVHAGFDAATGTLKAHLNVLGCRMMKDVAAELGVKYVNNGSLVIAFGPEQDEHVKGLYARGIANGVEGLKILDSKELHELEPNVAPDATSALFAPSAGIICPYSLAIAAVGSAMDNGCELKLRSEVTGIVREDGLYKVTLAGGAIEEARFVVNCAGVFSDKVAAFAGKCDFTVHPRSGEYLLLDRECGELVSRTIFRVPTKMGKGILVSPTAHGNLILGPTSTDIEDKEDKRTTREGLDMVAKGAASSVSGLPFRSVITSFTGLRSVGSTGDFIINESDGFVNCAGIESPGLSASPAIAIYVRNLLAGAGLVLEPKADYVPGRRVYKADEKLYSHIVCRCETVSEGEIVSAIHTNPGATDIDGVKKRTRSGMGRCQGGFCQPFVAEILARELGKNLLDITKSGPGSSILVGNVKEV